MLKYRFHAGPVRPFVNAGFMWSHQSTDVVLVYLHRLTWILPAG